MSYTKSLQNKLHKKVPLILKESFENYKRERGYLDEKDDEEVMKKLKKEELRLIPMVDQSIAKERVERTKKTFCITGGIGVGLAIFLSFFTGGLSLLTLLAPLVTASGAAYASMETVKISYHSRIRGGFESVIALHRSELEEKKKLEERKTSGATSLGKETSLEVAQNNGLGEKTDDKVTDILQKPQNRLSHVENYLNKKKEQSVGWAMATA